MVTMYQFTDFNFTFSGGELGGQRGQEPPLTFEGGGPCPLTFGLFTYNLHKRVDYNLCIYHVPSDRIV